VFVTIGRSSRVRPATIYDVAEAAGVSHQTVSRLLRGFKGIRPETRARVETAIAELQYRPNPAARSLKNGRTHRIGALTHDLTEVGPSKTIDGASHGAHDAGYLLDVISIDPRDPHAIEQAIQILRQQELAGVMVFAAADAVAAAVEPAGFAVPVVVDAELDEAQYAAPATPNGRGSEMLVEHLFRLGHRNFLHLAGPREWVSARNRAVAYTRALEARGLISCGVLEGDWSAASGYAAGQRIPLHGSVTAVVASNDQMALGVIRAVTERGIRVPDDMSVVGFDDIPEAAYFRPSLTTVSVDIDRGGRAAIARLIAQIEGRDAAPDLKDPGPHLRVRESSGPAPSRREPRARASPAFPEK
jgi:LacI family transcriptional regulator